MKKNKQVGDRIVRKIITILLMLYIFIITPATAFAAETRGLFNVAKIMTIFRAVGAMDPDEKTRNGDTMAIKYCPSSTWDIMPGLSEDFSLSKKRINLYSIATYFYANASTKHGDAILEKAIQESVKQVVIFRPSYDSRAYRFHKTAPDVKYYEVDLPEVQAEKVKLTQNILGITPDWVAYVPFDFNKQNIEAELRKADYDRTKKTLFIFAGTQFTSTDVVDSILRFIANHSAAGNSVFLEYILKPVFEKDYRFLGARAAVEAVAAWGIPYTFGINDGEVESILNKNGLELISDFGPEELTKNYLIKSNGKVDGPILGFFKIAYAMVPDSAQKEKLLKKPYKTVIADGIKSVHQKPDSVQLQTEFSGIKRILVAPLSFKYYSHNQDLKKKFTEDRYIVNLSNYAKEVSCGQLDIKVTVSSWIHMPRPLSKYRLVTFRLREMEDGSIWEALSFLKQDAVAELDNMYDLREFDALYLVPGVSPKEYGRTGILFRGKTGFHESLSPKGRFVPPVDIHTWDCPFPSVAYALPKLIAGYRNGYPVVPTLYSYDAQSAHGSFGYANVYLGITGTNQYYSTYVGPWDIQSQHGIKTNEGFSPQGMTSFTKIRLGWIPKDKIVAVNRGETRQIFLSPLVHGKGETLTVRLPIDINKYYLIENRQQEGIDRYLPSEGILIMKVDDTIPEGNGPVRVVNANPEEQYFKNAPFKTGGIFQDTENGITVNVLGKQENNYWIEIRRR